MNSFGPTILIPLDFDISPYTEIRNALMQCGINCGVNDRHQITISTQDGAIWPNAGNSFWITCASGRWSLFTWAPVGYWVPEETDIVELCRQCMTIGETAMAQVPSEICMLFGLVEMSDAEQELVYHAMQIAE